MPGFLEPSDDGRRKKNRRAASSFANDDGETKTWRGPAECGICEHKWQAVVEIERQYDEPILPFECPKCNSMAGQSDL